MKDEFFTVSETLEILKRAENGWLNHYTEDDANPYNMVTERFSDEKDSWESIGKFPLPFTKAPRSQEVADRECMNYYEEDGKTYIKLGDYRYTVNSEVEKIIENFLN